MALPKASLLHLTVKPIIAAGRATAAATLLKRLRPRLVRLPELDLRHVDALADYGDALLQAAIELRNVLKQMPSLYVKKRKRVRRKKTKPSPAAT